MDGIQNSGLGVELSCKVIPLHTPLHNTPACVRPWVWPPTQGQESRCTSSLEPHPGLKCPLLGEQNFVGKTFLPVCTGMGSERHLVLKAEIGWKYKSGEAFMDQGLEQMV